jgi:hypothetical protein
MKQNIKNGRIEKQFNKFTINGLIVEIDLTQGYKGLCALEDWEKTFKYLGHEFKLSEIKWFVSKQGANKKPYVRGGLYLAGKDKKILMHRVIMGIEDPKIFINHWNSTLNNCRENLSICNNMENTQYHKLRKDNSTGCTGVYEINGRYLVKVHSNKKAYYCGRFQSKEEAISIANNKRKELHGIYACH